MGENKRKILSFYEFEKITKIVEYVFFNTTYWGVFQFCLKRDAAHLPFQVLIRYVTNPEDITVSVQVQAVKQQISANNIHIPILQEMSSFEACVFFFYIVKKCMIKSYHFESLPRGYDYFCTLLTPWEDPGLFLLDSAAPVEVL